jgi:DNA gyrase/topoisomerase IV subunit A
MVERAVLEALDGLGAWADRAHVKCARIMQALADDHGVSPKYGYDALCTLSQPWLLHRPLVDFHGNWGSADEHDRPANPRYTEARLSTAGMLALAAERGAGPQVPIGLINGDLHVDGLAPPFSPTRVVATLLALADDPALSDAEIVARLGPPESPTGCGVACDLAVLAAGAPTGMVQTARLTAEALDRGAVIVLSHLPLGVGSDTVARAVADRVNARWRRDDLDDREALDELALPLRDIRDESSGDDTRIVCVLRPGADIGDCERRIASTWGVTIRREVRLPAPLAQLVRELVDEDATAQQSALAALMTT